MSVDNHQDSNPVSVESIALFAFFRKVLDDTRRELAMFYLGKVRFSPKEVSFMLGYSEPAAFYHAFRRWTGESPSAHAGATDGMVP